MRRFCRPEVCKDQGIHRQTGDRTRTSGISGEDFVLDRESREGGGEDE